jgi:glucose-6-phosphate isomerase
MADTTVPGPRTPIWKELETHAARLSSVHTRELIEGDAKRFEHFSADGAGLLLDYSRQRVDEPVMTKLAALADAVGLKDRIQAMWRGDAINATEGRAVLHVALRQPKGAGVGGAEIEKLVLDERERMLSFAESVRSGAIVGSSKKKFALVVNIGIGGSDLGPAMAVLALKNYSAGGPTCAFVSNVDGCKLADLLETANPETTLFIVASKTFTTLETLTNANSARAWLKGKLGEAAIREHFAAVSVNHKAMDAFGVHPDYRFQMWDWVGGRYSMWSSIGVSLAIAIGRENFLAFLRGGHEIDEHFRSAPWRHNLPVLMGLLGVWNINFRKIPTLAVLPYDDRLARFSAYLQQLEMESNGKHVTQAGLHVEWETCAVIWGEPGNNAQHSFFQLLHQGTLRAALDFVLPAKSSAGLQDQQNLSIANCLAQAEAFMGGNPPQAVRAELEKQKLPADRVEYLVPHKVHEGDRPSSIVLFAQLDPVTLGRLVALYEHKVFTQSVVWGINAFDQWGVELGKKLAEQLAPAVRDPAGAPPASAALGKLLGSLDKLRAS